MKHQQTYTDLYPDARDTRALSFARICFGAALAIVLTWALVFLAFLF